MNIKKAHCLFEQSGTFKNEFIKLGIPAEDYDIQDEFGQTDHVIDLYAEIEKGYEGEPSIFDDIDSDDIVFAFFPCVRFENQIMLWFRGQSMSQKDWNDAQKIEYCMKTIDELVHNYHLVNKLFMICIDRGLRLVFENPYSEEHFLRRYWCILPAIIDRDRTERGDYFTKPTQYFFYNCKPENNFIFEITENNSIECKDAIKRMNSSHYGFMGAKNQKDARSMIHPDYANRFIREFIL